MTATPSPSDADNSALQSREIRRVSLPAAVLSGLLAAVIAATAAFAFANLNNHPGDDSAEAGFARDMQVHHAQAVELSTIIRDQTSDPMIRQIAYDILTGQQQQMGQMFAWLRSWGLPSTSGRTPMSWMKPMDHSGMNDMSGMDMGDAVSMKLLPDGRMPGMASPEDIAKLKSLRGVEAEKLFLKLMIVHHRSGVMMAQAALDQAKDPQVKELAKTIVASQTVEIQALTDLLQERGEAAPS